MKFKLQLLCIGVIFSGSCEAQTLSPAVISSSGGFTSNGSAMLSSTVGEMTMVATFNNNNVILTQGFQQPEDFNVSTRDVDPAVSGIIISPNPTQGVVRIIFSKQEELALSITIFDMSGKTVYRAETKKGAQNNYVSLDLSSFAAGDYLLDCKIPGKGAAAPILFSQKITLAK